LTSFNVDIAVVSETHLKKHANSCLQVNVADQQYDSVKAVTSAVFCNSNRRRFRRHPDKDNSVHAGLQIPEKHTVEQQAHILTSAIGLMQLEFTSHVGGLNGDETSQEHFDHLLYLAT
jgi:hypothetical protein